MAREPSPLSSLSPLAAMAAAGAAAHGGGRLAGKGDRIIWLTLGGFLLLHALAGSQLAEGSLDSEKQQGNGAGVEETILNDLIKWLNENGVSDVGSQSSYLRAVVEQTAKAPPARMNARVERADISLVANKNIEAGTILLSVPSKLIISSSKLIAKGFAPHDHPESQIWYRHYTAMAAWLLIEKAKGKESFFAPYISSIPSYVPLPMLFEPDLVKEFEYEKLITDVHMTVADWELEYKRCIPEKIANASYEDFAWAMSIIWSRTFSSLAVENETSGEGYIDEWNLVFVPFADMLNHHDHFQAYWTCATDGRSCSFSAVDSVAEGMPVYTTYGQKPSDELALAYGFVPSEPANDYAVLFRTISDVVEYYISKSNEESYDESHRQKAEYMAEKAKDEVENMVRGHEEINSESWMLDYTEDVGFTIRKSAQVEPRLVAALAAIYLFEIDSEEFSYEELANVSIAVGSDFSVQHCEELLKYPQYAVHAMQTAMFVLHARVSDMLALFSTSYEHDKVELGQLLNCRETSDLIYQNEVCKKEWESRSREWEIILRLRLVKKSLLNEVQGQFGSCWGAATDSIDEDGGSLNSERDDLGVWDYDDEYSPSADDDLEEEEDYENENEDAREEL